MHISLNKLNIKPQSHPNSRNLDAFKQKSYMQCRRQKLYSKSYIQKLYHSSKIVICNVTDVLTWLHHLVEVLLMLRAIVSRLST